MGKESFSASAGSSPEVQPSKPLGVGCSPTRAEAAEAAEAAERPAAVPCGESGANPAGRGRGGGGGPPSSQHHTKGQAVEAGLPILCYFLWFFLNKFLRKQVLKSILRKMNADTNV